MNITMQVSTDCHAFGMALRVCSINSHPKINSKLEGYRAGAKKPLGLVLGPTHTAALELLSCLLFFLVFCLVELREREDGGEQTERETQRERELERESERRIGYVASTSVWSGQCLNKELDDRVDVENLGGAILPVFNSHFVRSLDLVGRDISNF